MLDKTYSLLVGTYSDLDALAHQPYAPVPGQGIYSMELGQDGKLSLTGVTQALNPAVLIPGPDNTMYGILETIRENGTIVRYRVQEDGNLEQLQSWEASGKSTCYLALAPAGDAAIVINYWDATIDVAPVKDGVLGPVHQSFVQHHRPTDAWRQVENREDHWGNRQVGPHAHCAHFWRDWVFIPDLGENAVFQYRWDAEAKTIERETWIDFDQGSGPRHMAMHPDLDICYVSNELFNTVCAAHLDGSNPNEIKPRLVPFQYESTIDDRDQVSYVSEIKLSPDARFLYVSNRGDNSLTIFAVAEDGSLTRTGLVSTGGKFPRHFAITPDGKGVLVANQDSGHLRYFTRDVETGALSLTEEVVEIPAPNYIRFL
ncbi:MAG: lactonase family protein [Actinomycetota bacterium]